MSSKAGTQRRRLLAISALAILLAGIASAGAQIRDLRPGERENLLLQNRDDEFLILQQRQRRQDFQEQQLKFREQDRRAIQQPGRRLEIPVIRRNCQTQVFGNNFLKSCR